jgi:hypothetical protein
MKRAMPLLVFALLGCGPAATVPPRTAAPLAVVKETPEDTSLKQDLRLMPPEVYVRSYLAFFGNLAPGAVEQEMRGKDNGQLFDTWNDYLQALGFPDYKLDLPRATQTNAIMVATFERLGVALCDRALEHDWKANPATPVASRVVFPFEPKRDLDANEFAERFDVMHRTFLSYPASLAPGRTDDFFGLYQDVRNKHAALPKKTRFTPEEAGWAAVCYGLVRHPEFYLY